MGRCNIPGMSDVREITIGEGPSDVRERPRRAVKLARTGRVPSVLVFPAWVVSNQTRTSHLHLANPVAAYECDGEGAEGLQQGVPYFFVFHAPLELVLTRGGGRDWDEHAIYLSRPDLIDDGVIVTPGYAGVGYQMEWNPDFDGYHDRGREVIPRGRRREVGRHRWDLHCYESPGSGLRAAVRTSDAEVRRFAEAGVKSLVHLFDRETGVPRPRPHPWGFMSAVIGGTRVL